MKHSFLLPFFEGSAEEKDENSDESHAKNEVRMKHTDSRRFMIANISNWWHSFVQNEMDAREISTASVCSNNYYELSAIWTMNSVWVLPFHFVFRLTVERNWNFFVDFQQIFFAEQKPIYDYLIGDVFELHCCWKIHKSLLWNCVRTMKVAELEIRRNMTENR